jgi:hypothetical protein
VFGAWLQYALGSAQRNTLLMDEITPGLAATLALLTAALDEPGADVAASMAAFAAEAHAAIGSYLGLTVSISAGAGAVTFTTLADSEQTPAIRASLRMLLPDVASTGADGVGPALILYAGRSGAFVDLAADLAWLTGRELTDFVLDQQLQLPAQPDGTLTLLTASLIDQAIGVLIGRGYAPDQARRELDTDAARAATDRAGAAARILAALTPINPEPDPDPR